MFPFHIIVAMLCEWLQRERGHAGAADLLRVHDAVGAGLVEAVDGAVDAGPGHVVEIDQSEITQ